MSSLPTGKGVLGRLVQGSNPLTSSPDIYVAGCESPCSNFFLGRLLGHTAGGVPIYGYETKCCGYPRKDLSNNPLTEAFAETTTFPPGISQYLTVILSSSGLCPPLGANHCIVGEMKYGTLTGAPGGHGWTGTVAGMNLEMWVDNSCTHPIRWWISSACGSTATTGNTEACGSCVGVTGATPCPYLLVDCSWPLRAHTDYTNLGNCCPGASGNCTAAGHFAIIGYCRNRGLGRNLKEPTPSSPFLGGPIGGSPPGIFTYSNCPCPPAAPCPATVFACCDLTASCNCPTLTVTLSNGAGGAACFNGDSGSFTCGSLVGNLRTWNGTITTNCAGVLSLTGSVTCDSTSSPGTWSVSLSAGAGCTFTGGTVSTIDCVNKTVTITGVSGGGVTCNGMTLTVTISW